MARFLPICEKKSLEIIKINFSVDRWAFGHWISIEFTSTSGGIQKWVYCKIPIDFSTSPLCVHFTVATFYMSLNLNWHSQSSFWSIFIFFCWTLCKKIWMLCNINFDTVLGITAMRSKMSSHQKKRKGKKEPPNDFVFNVNIENMFFWVLCICSLLFFNRVCVNSWKELCFTTIYARKFHHSFSLLLSLSSALFSPPSLSVRPRISRKNHLN